MRLGRQRSNGISSESSSPHGGYSRKNDVCRLQHDTHVFGVGVCGKVWFRDLDSSTMFNGRGNTNAIDDPDNLDPVITYRHVLSSNVGVQYVQSEMFAMQYDRIFAVTPCMYDHLALIVAGS